MKPHPVRRLLLAAALLLGSILPATAADFTSTWNNTTGNWTDTTKWSTPGAPGTFPNNGSPTPTYNAIQTDGTLTVDQAITIDNYTLGGGGTGAKNTGAGFDFTVNGLLTWNATGFSGSAFNGTGTINANGGAIFTGGGKSLDGRVLNLSGNSTWSTDRFYLANSASLVNTATGTLTSTLTGFNTIQGSGSFTNAGTFTQASGGGYTAIRTPSTNTGTMNVNSGTLAFEAAITNAGALVAGAGTVLGFDGGNVTHTLNAGTNISGAGTVRFGGANTNTSFNAGTYNVTGTTQINAVGSTSANFNAAASTGSLSLSSGSLVVSSTLSLGDGSTARTSTWSGGGFTLTNGGTLTNTVGSTLTVNITGTSSDLNASGTGTKTFNNEGTFTKGGATAALTRIHTVFNNTGTVNANIGTLDFNGGVTQHSGSTLTGGTWNVTGSTLNINTGSNITTLGSAATVKLSGATATFTKINNLATNEGTFHLANNRDFTTAGAYANSGTTRVEDSTTVMTIGAGGASAYTQTGASSFTILAGGAMIDTSAFNLNGGSLVGTGTIDGPLSATSGNATTIAPGASPGTITVNGSTVLGTNNTLTMEVGGLAAGIDYDVLDVNGILTLGGLLDIDLINGFENSALNSDIFTIATADSPILGSFSNVLSGSRLTTNLAYSFEVWYGAGSPYGANNLVLAHIPEPSRAVLMALGAISMVLRRRKENTGTRQRAA